MTAEERALAMERHISEQAYEEDIVSYAYLLEQIQLAVDEARADERLENASHCSDCYAKGFSDARERAAKAMEFQIGKSFETSFDKVLVDGGIAVIRALRPTDANEVSIPEEK